MSSVELLESVSFNPSEYDPHQWFIEQDSFGNCAYDDEPIDIPVLIISEYTMAHYKYYISICCEKNLDDFYECLGTQPLKMVFSHLINDDYVKRHGYNVFPDTTLSRNYHIKGNELYLDTNEVELDNDKGHNEGEGYYLGDSDEESSSDDEEEEQQHMLERTNEEFQNNNDLIEVEEIKEEDLGIEGLEKVTL